jgi:hypothetical protein
MVLRLRWRQPPTGGEELGRAARLAAGRRGADSHGAGGDEMVARLGNREWERVEESEPLGEIFFFLTDLFSWLRCIWALDWYDFFFFG